MAIGSIESGKADCQEPVKQGSVAARFLGCTLSRCQSWIESPKRGGESRPGLEMGELFARTKGANWENHEGAQWFAFGRPINTASGPGGDRLRRAHAHGPQAQRQLPRLGVKRRAWVPSKRASQAMQKNVWK